MKYTHTIATGLLYAITSSWALADGHANHKTVDEKTEKAVETKKAAKDHDEKHEGFEQHGTHEHGKARLMVAKTDSGLDMMLESASFNFIGFGHKPTTDADKATFAKAKSTLEAGEQIFIINKQAECTLASSELTSTVIDGHKKDHEKHDDKDHDDDHDDHKKGHDKHDDDDHDDHKKGHDKHDDDDHDDHKKGHDKHDDDDHDDHKKGHDKHDDDDHDDHKKGHDKHDDKDHDGHDHKGKTHSNIDVSWSFTCKNPQKADAIEVKLFTAFPDNLEQLNIEWITDTSASVSKLTQDGVINLKP